MSKHEDSRVAAEAAVPGGVFAMVSKLLSAIGTIWIFLLMFLIVADVLGRNFLNHPITGVAEIAAHSVVAIVFLQISLAVLSDKLTTADFIVRVLRARAPVAIDVIQIVFLMFGALVFAGITYAAWPEMLNAWRTNDYFGVRGLFTIPTLPFRAIIVIGSVAAVVAYLILIIGKIKRVGHSGGIQ